MKDPKVIADDIRRLVVELNCALDDACSAGIIADVDSRRMATVNGVPKYTLFLRSISQKL